MLALSIEGQTTTDAEQDQEERREERCCFHSAAEGSCGFMLSVD